ncbi:hypothetical protein [Sphingomonas hengshuiensis]|uniref:STAS/SEC14 domain-containing protein n=1 Tax=Sphingomonas hengshuiensis TaxID=1609977 RepID=A0A7U4LGS3_9SPHN|nr:hypothetical protein [Sphingomonas hengshuiensis]AJP73805.1 hypothetical protein TS85_21410 [Sphingomonas hengshuiensis]
MAVPEPSSHSIAIDRERLLIDVRIRGFLLPEDASWLGEEVRAAILTLGDAVGRHVTLYDLTEMPVAPKETLLQTQRTFDNPAVRAMWARKAAFVSPSALTRLQIGRLREVRPDFGIYADRETAIAWLLEE